MLLLWFDVGIKRYTTERQAAASGEWLWFDVGIKRYTTKVATKINALSCGLM